MMALQLMQTVVVSDVPSLDLPDVGNVLDLIFIYMTALIGNYMALTSVTTNIMCYYRLRLEP